MSGIEIVGLILGAFPLALGAIEQYDKTLKTLRLWNTGAHQVTANAIKLELRVQETLFRNSFLSLLLLFLDRPTVLLLLADPGELSRQKDFLHDSLKTCLGEEQWSIYNSVIDKIHHTLQRLTQEVYKSSASSDADKVTALFTRVKFSFRVNIRNSLLDEIKDANRTLASLTSQHRTLVKFQRSESRASSGSFSKFQSLRTVLGITVESAGQQLQCPSTSPCKHSLELYSLTYRNDSIENGHEHPLPFVPRLGLQSCASTTPPMPVSMQLFRPELSKNRSGKEMKTLCDLLQANVVPIVLPDRTRAQSIFLPQILESRPSSDITSRRSTTEEKNLFYWESLHVSGQFVSMARRQAVEHPDIVTLRDILWSTGKYSCFPRYFYERDRSRLAASIALATLLYGETDLIPDGWSSKDVCFNSAKMHDLISDSLQHPYFLWCARTAGDAGSKRATTMQSAAPAPATSLFYSLGIVLMELVLNQPIATFRQHANEPEADIIRRIEPLVDTRGGPRWTQVISKCLHGPLLKPPEVWNTNFLQFAYAEIFEPLFAFDQLPGIQAWSPDRRSNSTQQFSGYGDQSQSYQGRASSNTHALAYNTRSRAYESMVGGRPDSTPAEAPVTVRPSQYLDMDEIGTFVHRLASDDNSWGSIPYTVSSSRGDRLSRSAEARNESESDEDPE